MVHRMSHRILTLGYAEMDMTVNADTLPFPGETRKDAGGLIFSPGGIAASAAVALARLGEDSIFCARIGEDLNGKRLRKFYEDVGIDTSYLSVSHTDPTCTTCILSEKDAPSRRIVFPGAADGMTNGQIEDACASCDALYLTLEAPIDQVVLAASVAHERGLPIFLDGAPAYADIDLSALPPVTVFSPNDDEAFALTGIRPAGTDSALLTALELQKLVNAQYYVIKLGERGAFIYDGIYCHSAAAFVVPVTDLTGAGSAFTAALCAEYLHSSDILGAARFANATAACAIQKKGLFASLPTRAEVDVFLARRGSY